MSLHSAVLESEEAALAAIEGVGRAELNMIAEADGYKGVTPAHLAVKNGQSHTLTRLHDAGADLEIPDSDHKATPLGWAAFFARADMVRLLIELGANSDCPYPPLEIAESGANGDWQGYVDIRPDDYREVVEILRQHRAQR